MTDELNARAGSEAATPVTARIVRDLRSHRTLLAANGVSRNHILADSRIRVMLDQILERRSVNGALRIDQRTAVARFLEAITGYDGSWMLGRLEAAADAGVVEVHAMYNEIANGILNLRMGLATFNERISNLFDPVIIDGRLDPRSAAIRDAVLELAHHRAITRRLAFDSLTMARDRATGRPLASSSMVSLDLTRVSGTAIVDHFTERSAPPARRGSISHAMRNPPEVGRASAALWDHYSRNISDANRDRERLEARDVEPEGMPDVPDAWDPSFVPAGAPAGAGRAFDAPSGGAPPAGEGAAMDAEEADVPMGEALDPGAAEPAAFSASEGAAVEAGQASGPMSDVVDPAAEGAAPLGPGADPEMEGEILLPDATDTAEPPEIVDLAAAG